MLGQVHSFILVGGKSSAEPLIESRITRMEDTLIVIKIIRLLAAIGSLFN